MNFLKVLRAVTAAYKHVWGRTQNRAMLDAVITHVKGGAEARQGAGPPYLGSRCGIQSPLYFLMKIGLDGALRRRILAVDSKLPASNMAGPKGKAPRASNPCPERRSSR